MPPSDPMHPPSLTLRALLAALLAPALVVGLAGGCTSTESPVHEPAPEVSAPRAPAGEPTAAAPAPEDAAAAEIAAERRAEESVERVPVAEPSADEQEDSVLEVWFDEGTATLSAKARARLDAMYERLIAEENDFYLDVQGHTDASGSPAVNQRLAEQRAEAVRRYLHQTKGVPLELMGVTPLGGAVPVASNQTPAGRERNRRAVVVVLLPP